MSKNQILSIKEEDTMLSENLRDVEKKIEGACIRSGRNPKEVTLIAVCGWQRPLTKRPRKKMWWSQF